MKTEEKFKRHQRAVAAARKMAENPATPPSVRNVARELLEYVNRHPSCSKCKQAIPTPATCNWRCVKP